MGKVDSEGTVREGEQFDIMARMVKHDRSIFTQSDVTSMAVRIYDMNSTTPLTAIQTDTIADVSVTNAASGLPYVSDTLQTDDRWDKDDDGYQVIYTVDPTSFSTAVPGGHTLRIELKLITASFGDKHGVWQLLTESLSA